MPQGDVFIAEACALQQYSHAIWVKTFTTNAVNDPSHHMSAESRPSEPYINTCTHVCLLSCVVGSWTLIKAAEDSCQPSAVVLIDVVPRDCYMFWHIQYIDAQWHGVVLEPDFFATVIINMLTGFDCGWHLHFLRQKKKKKERINDSLSPDCLLFLKLSCMCAALVCLMCSDWSKSCIKKVFPHISYQSSYLAQLLHVCSYRTHYWLSLLSSPAGRSSRLINSLPRKPDSEEALHCRWSLQDAPSALIIITHSPANKQTEHVFFVYT